MCGIVGYVAAPGGRAPPPGLGERMTAAILHRGPDDGGVHLDAHAMLGMRRLSIIDTVGGHQPMYAADGDVCIVFNGEIYNYRELRDQLQRAGHAFATQSDTEVLLHGYLEYGEGVLDRLDGMFAVAIRDRRDGSLLLARDRFGEKPLYYALDAQRLLFASELKAMLEADDCPRGLDHDALRAYLTFGYVPAPMAILEGVQKLPPGHALRYADGAITLRRYWQPDLTTDTHLRDEEAAEKLAYLLDRAVASRLVSDVPFGAFLSGGIDSSTVVALMARHMDRPVKTFTIGFADAAFNELDDARSVATHLGTDHHELVVAPDSVALLDTLVWHFDEPFADASAVPTYLVSQLARQHVAMVLTGDGGDELFGGYDRYLRTLSLERLGALRRPASLALRLAGAALPDPLGGRVSRIGERLGLPFDERYLSSMALMRRDTASALRGARAGAMDSAAHYRLPALQADGADFGAGGSTLNRMVAIDLNSYLPDDILVKLDRMAMASSLEGRSPFLEPQLAAFALSLPERLRVRGRRGKHLLREVAAPWLPARAISKPKQGFGVPLAAWFRGPLQAMASDTFASRAFRERGLTDATHAQRLLAEHVRGSADHSETLWQVLCLERWAQRFSPGIEG